MTSLPGKADKDDTVVDAMPCRRCGECCRRHQAMVTPAEVDAIAAKLGISHQDFMDLYVDPDWPGTRYFLLRHGQDGCVFLVPGGTGEYVCRIHDHKPVICRQWAASKQKTECRAGLDRERLGHAHGPG